MKISGHIIKSLCDLVSHSGTALASDTRLTSESDLFFFSSRRRHTRCSRDWSSECALPIYYRLSVIPIQVPALRERREDIPLLARHFLERFRKTMEKPIDAISPEAMSKLEAYDWPGNVRELENTMERAVALETGKEISVRVLPARILGYAGTPLGAAEGIELPEDGVDFEKVVAANERMYLQAALEKAGGVRTRASEFLKITYRSFRHYAKKHSL